MHLLIMNSHFHSDSHHKNSGRRTRLVARMGLNSLNVCFLLSRLLLLITLISSLSLAHTRRQHLDALPSRAAADAEQQEAGTAELQTTLGGNLKDFSIVIVGSGKQASRSTSGQDAAQTYREALKTDPNNAEVHFELSLVLAKLGDARSAREELESAIRLDRHLAKARNQL